MIAAALLLSLWISPISARAADSTPPPAPASTPAPTSPPARKEKVVARETFWLAPKGASTHVTLTVPDAKDWDGGAYDTIRITRGSTAKGAEPGAAKAGAKSEDALELGGVYGARLDALGLDQGAEIKRTTYVDLVALDAHGTRRALVLHLWAPPGPDEHLFYGYGADGKLALLARIDGPIARITDYDHDGLMDILLKGAAGQPGTYAPYVVYRQTLAGGAPNFVLDEILSRKWSEENHYVWRGPKSREGSSN